MFKNISIILCIVFISIFFVSCDWHSVDLGGAMHKKGYRDPLTQCTECHGEELEGNGSVPSCYECHEKTWE
jgi:hypothetical protein